MIRFLYRKYWAIGFRLNLYDLLAPRAYLDSLFKCVKNVQGKEGGAWLDVGCGSGLSLPLLKNWLQIDGKYYGVDITVSGLARTLKKIKALDVNGCCVLTDFTKSLPFKDNSLDVIIAHFSIYIINDKKVRLRALKYFYNVLKVGGTLTLANPSKEYNARCIIQESLQKIRKEEGTLMFWSKKFILYPLTYWFGLRFIERQLQSGVWKAYAENEIYDEIRSAGFSVNISETVYAGCGYLIVAEKSG